MVKNKKFIIIFNECIFKSAKAKNFLNTSVKLLLQFVMFRELKKLVQLIRSLIRKFSN